MKTKLSLIILILQSFVFNDFSAQNNFKNTIIKYSDSVSSKNYGLVALHKKNKKVETIAIGNAYPNKKMTSEMVFNIGSLTKTFTAVLVLQEIEKGNMKLNDSLHTYFPSELCSNPNVDLDITIEQLLTHKSGLGELVVDSLFNKAFSNPYFEYNHTFLFNKIPKAIAKPNTKYDYSNTNYILLGYILEVINDKPYSEILRERIFEPCGLKNTYAYYSKNIKNVAHPIYKNIDLSDEGFFKYYQNYAYSAGGISSNLEDLSKFFDHLYNLKLINKESFTNMVTLGSEKYGLGIEKYKINNEIYYGHGGDNISFRVRNYYHPKTKELTIIMANHYKDPYSLKIVNEFFKK